MPDLIERQLIIENFQDSLRLVRNLMEFSVKEFAEAIGATSQIVTDLETKKSQNVGSAIHFYSSFSRYVFHAKQNEVIDT